MLQPHADVRDCRLYRFRVYHPDDMVLPAEQRRVVLGYVGETIREPLARLLEHVYDQPWADTIVGWDLDPRIFPGKQAVLRAEAEAIRAEKPLYNVIGNERNRERIPPPVAMRQRRERDAGRPVGQRWVHPDDRGGPTRVSGRSKAAVSADRKWTRREKHLAGIHIGWAVLAVAGIVWLFLDDRLGLETALAAATTGYVAVWWLWAGCPVRTRGVFGWPAARARARRRLRRGRR